MAQKTGIATQIGYVSEVTPGTAVTAGMTFLPLATGGLDKTIDFLESDAIIAGRETDTSDMWALGAIKCGGPVGFELYNKNLRFLFKNMFGAESGSGPYTYTPGDLAGLALTVQEGIPDLAGTVQPWTFTGCKISEWEIAVDEGQIATLGLDILAMNAWDVRTVADGVTNSTTAVTSATAVFGADDVGKPISGSGIPSAATIASVQSATAATISAAATATATSVTFTIGIALATASYTSALTPLHYVHSTLSVAGSAFKVKSAKIKGNNGFAERRFCGQRTTDEPLAEKKKVYTGELMAEFNNMTAYRRFVNGTEAALVITISNGTNSVVVTANVRHDGSKPKADLGLIQQSIPFTCKASSTDASAITAVVSTA